MPTDPMVIATYVAPIVTLLVGAWLNRVLERRVKLVTFLAHTAAVQTTGGAQGNPLIVHTHSIVIRNAGKLAAHNVRIGHQNLPDFSIYPPIKYSRDPVPHSADDILVPLLLPGDQITVTYLYFPPMLWHHVNARTRCDEGPANVVTVLPTPQYPKSVQRASLALIVVGAATVLYWLVHLGSYVATR